MNDIDNLSVDDDTDTLSSIIINNKLLRDDSNFEIC
jgi:hypothetical protein